MKPVVVLSSKGNLTVADIEAVAFGRASVELAAEARTRLSDFRQRAETDLKNALKADENKRVYGLNTGFGSNFKEKVSDADLKQLQVNLILSHCVGMGPLAPAPVVRATMLLRAASLARGQSIVRPQVVQALIDLLNEEITPAVPRYGSVSASGDLAPLSHVAAVVIGEGRVLNSVDGSVETAAYLAAKKSAFKPISLEMKEGLALNNGCQYSNAWGALTVAMMRRLIEAASLNTALGVQVMRGTGRPFRADLHALRAHPGSQDVARWVYDLLDGYEYRDAGTDAKYEYDQKIQDPYNLRCSAQALGPCLDLIDRAETTMTIEARSVTDNPIDLNSSLDNYDLDLITSGGHFHGMPLAVDIYGLLQAAGIMARLANMRCERIVDSQRNKGLGPQVRGADRKSTESGLMIWEYTTAGLCNHIWGLASPSHLMSLSTDSGQEDHVSMAANVAMRAYEAAERLGDILAIEMAFASQAEHVRGFEAPLAAAEAGVEANKRKYGHVLKPAELGKATQAALEEVRKTFPLIAKDQELSWKMMELAEKVRSGAITAATGYGYGRH
ncbi:MAG: aromatic amino acid ammonia-lyase [Hyphomonadaceae bacterium]